MWVIMVGNLPALFSPGPSHRGICLIKLSEARKASYFLAAISKKVKFTGYNRQLAYLVSSRAFCLC